MECGDCSVDVGDSSKEVEPSANGKAECVDIIEGSSESPQQKKQKIDIFLKAAGNAPIMKRKKWSVDQEKTIGFVINFVRKYLHLETNESLFLYVNQTFAPSPDQMVKNLYDCFGSDGKLTLHYCQIQAWG